VVRRGLTFSLRQCQTRWHRHLVNGSVAVLSFLSIAALGLSSFRLYQDFNMTGPPARPFKHRRRDSERKCIRPPEYLAWVDPAERRPRRTAAVRKSARKNPLIVSAYEHHASPKPAKLPFSTTATFPTSSNFTFYFFKEFCAARVKKNRPAAKGQPAPARHYSSAHAERREWSATLPSHCPQPLGHGSLSAEPRPTSRFEFESPWGGKIRWGPGAK